MKGASTKTILSRLLCVFYLIAVCFLCFTSGNSFPTLKTSFFEISTDKLVHFIMFAPYPILMYLSFDHPAGKPGKSIAFVLVTLVIGCTIAALTEVVQEYIPTREMDIKDFYADAAALVSVSLFVLTVDLAKHQR